MATFYSSASSKSVDGSTCYAIWALEVSVSGTTVTATGRVYTTRNWKWASMASTISCTLGGHSVFSVSGSKSYPSSSSSWSSGSWSIGGRNYTTRYTFGTWSYNFSSGGNISCSFSFSSSASGTYAPPSGTHTASGTVTVTSPTVTVYFDSEDGYGGPSSQTFTSGQSGQLTWSEPSHDDESYSGYTVYFNGNGGSASKSSATATNWRNYYFDYWTDSSGRVYYPGSYYTFTSNTTLYANYDYNISRGSITAATASRSAGTATRTVTFNGNGGTPSESSINSTAPATYSCSGWYTSATGGTRRCASGGSYTPSSSETLYAQWTENPGTFTDITLPTATREDSVSTRTITLDAATNGGTCKTAALQSQGLTSYEFEAWYNSAEGGLVKGNAGDTYTPSGAETMYAHWIGTPHDYSAVILPDATKPETSDTITITFDANTGTCETKSLDSTRITTYPLRGWYTMSSGGSNRGAAGMSYLPEKEETLYAQFNTVPGQYSAIDLPTAEKPEWVFNGWAEDPSATHGVKGQYIPTKATTLYATWTEAQSKGNFKVNGEWTEGKIWVKSNGIWYQSKKLYLKVDGAWVEGK